MSGDITPLDAGDRPCKVERSVTLAHAPASVTGARQRLCSDLQAMQICEARVDDAALVLSELVSNALRHAQPLQGPDGDCVGVAWRVRMDDSATDIGWLEISVRDGGSGTMPRVAEPAVFSLGGRGLGIVQALAGRWGTEMDATTTTVWAVLEISDDDLVRCQEQAEGEPTTQAAPGPSTEPGSADVVDLPLRAPKTASARSALL